MLSINLRFVPMTNEECQNRSLAENSWKTHKCVFNSSGFRKLSRRASALVKVSRCGELLFIREIINPVHFHGRQDGPFLIRLTILLPV